MVFNSYIVGLIIACISYLLYHKLVSVHPSIVVTPEKRYDYIIVGAGTAGCVLAARLSEHPSTKVLLIEAGDHMGYFTRIPLTATAAQLGPNDWSVRTTAQKYSSFGLWDQTQLLPRGKGLGGSGQINFLLHGVGLPGDFDRWSRLGFKDWTKDDLTPYFIKAFGTDKSEFDSSRCKYGPCPNLDAPMKLELIDEHNELGNIFQQASSQLKDKVTFIKPTATVKDGVRYSTFDAYLKPVLSRRNLHVALNTQGVSIRFDNMTASSVYILRKHRELDNIFVNKEIILSAGAIKSPQLLMLSGIGPKHLIKRLRLNLVSDNKYVGQNLHDHMNMPIYITIKKPISVTLSKVFTFKTVWDYYLRGQGYIGCVVGLLSFPPVSGVEYLNSSALILFAMGSASEKLLRDVSNYKPQVFRDTYPFYNNSLVEGFMFLATCVQPKSRGYVTLKDSSTSVPPMVDPNYLFHKYDVKCILKAMRRAEKIVATPAFKGIGARIHWPRSERCLSLWRYSSENQLGSIPKRRKVKLSPVEKEMNENKLKTIKISPKQKTILSPPDDYLECLVREVAVTGHHAGGTCAAGKVVDNQLRVHSVSGLRVVDASVLPSPISLFPNSVLVALAEKAADLIIRNKN